MVTHKKYPAYTKATPLLLALFVLSGCASFTKDGGLNDVKLLTEKHISQQVVWSKTTADQHLIAERVAELMQKDLDVELAVQIALLNNKSLQADLFELGISEADMVQAGRLPNPRFSMLYARNNGDYKIEQALTFNIFSLLTMPKLVEIERLNFEQTKQQVAIKVLQVAYQTRQAYFNAVAANQQYSYSLQVKTSAEASAEMAKRMVKAGNWNQLELAREQGFYAEAALDVLEAQQKSIVAKESLARLLGMSANQLTLQSRLPDLPKTLTEPEQFTKQAFAERLDLQAARLRTENMAKRLGLSKTTRFINVLEIGPARVLEGSRNDAYKKGVDIAFELPLFDWGSAKVARAEASYMQSVNEAAYIANNAQSEIREAYGYYQTSYDIAKQYADEIVPLRKKILDEKLLRYNGMLVSPFELFADARAQVSSVKTYIQKLNAFWLADTELQMTRIGNLHSVEGK
ncbi:MAG: RND transporter [Methylotenera sp. 24-45-7]|jgi:outer membrane protein TolC|nr:MAG: RND transporter [Methylotenera sp. 24-45-7]OZA07893.1 MAG: RND transporter [Methylotenera sp. 17-45-7]HQS43197.1 TolC family protein [Methylotenera sp.]